MVFPAKIILKITVLIVNIGCILDSLRLRNRLNPELLVDFVRLNTAHRLPLSSIHVQTIVFKVPSLIRVEMLRQKRYVPFVQNNGNMKVYRSVVKN